MEHPVEGQQGKRRPFGSIRENGGGWQLEYVAQGKRHWEQYLTQEAAEKQRIVRESEVRKNQFTPPRIQKVKYEQLEAAYVRERQQRQRFGKIKGGPPQASSLRHLRTFFGGRRLEQIDYTMTQEYADRRLNEPVGTASWRTSRRTSPTTVAQELQLLRQMVKWGYEVGLVAKLPKKFYTIPVKNERKVFLNDDELADVLRELGRTDVRHPAPYLRAPFEFASLTGWRSGEVKRLTWDLVDWYTGYLHLPGTMTKNGEPRKFPFHNYPQLRTLLEQQRSVVEHLRRVYGNVVPWVFPGRHGDQIRDWWKGWRAAVLRAATMQVNGKRCVRPDRLSMVRVDADGTIRHDRRPHDFRRTARRRMRRAGVPAETIMALLGWKTREMLDHYDVEDDQDLEDGVAKLARNLPGNFPGLAPTPKHAAS